MACIMCAGAGFCVGGAPCCGPADIFRIQARPRWPVPSFEEFVLEDQQINDRNRDVGIGQIEDGAEKVVAAVNQKGEPAGNAIPLEKGEIEHIDDPSHHQRGVSVPEMRHLRRCGCREDHPIECTVDHVADGSGQDERQSHEHAGRRLAAKQVSQIVPQQSDHGQPETAQDEFPPVERRTGRELHAECRTVVLDEPQLEPGRNDHDGFVERHVRLYPDLQCLIDKDQQNQQDGEFLGIHRLHNFWQK